MGGDKEVSTAGLRMDCFDTIPISLSPDFTQYASELNLASPFELGIQDLGAS